VWTSVSSGAPSGLSDVETLRQDGRRGRRADKKLFCGTPRLVIFTKLVGSTIELL
jgi:hypothetical protein